MKHKTISFFLFTVAVFVSTSLTSEYSENRTDSCDGSFVHPGLLTTYNDLTFIRAQVNANKEPWATAYKQLLSSTSDGLLLSSLSYKPTPIVEVIARGGSDPANNDIIERRDAHAAYAHALLWSITQDNRHAEKAIEILNVWAYTHKSRADGVNKALSVGWVAPVFARAAEIVRYTYPNYKQADIYAFSKMIREVYLPLVYDGARTTAGNWETSMAEAVMSIGVFLNDKVVFDQGLMIINRKIPEYIYLTDDGVWPHLPPTIETRSDVNKFLFWYRGNNPSRILTSPPDPLPPAYDFPFSFYDGQVQETCRDMNHTQIGLAAAINCLEIAYSQGIDLYDNYKERITRAMEFNSKVMIDIQDGKGVPADLCGGLIALANARFMGFEIAYNHYHHRLKIDLPFTKEFIRRVRALNYPYNPLLHIAFPALTHEQLINVKIPENLLPLVSVTDPANNALFRNGKLITLHVTATDPDCSITKVEFFEGDNKLGEDLSAPYSFDWTTVPNGTYQITAKAYDNLDAVSVSDIVTVVVNQSVNPLADVSTMQAFTPNGDGQNEVWKIEGIENIRDIHLTIYNDKGQLVYKAMPYLNDWDGTKDGKPLAVGAYYYVLKADEDVKKGSFLLLR